METGTSKKKRSTQGTFQFLSVRNTNELKNEKGSGTILRSFFRPIGFPIVDRRRTGNTVLNRSFGLLFLLLFLQIFFTTDMVQGADPIPHSGGTTSMEKPKSDPKRSSAIENPSYYLKNEGSQSEEVRVQRGITFWVQDGEGDWKIPLPNWTVEDIMKRLDSPKLEGPVLPYSIQSIDVNGRVESGMARLNVQYRIYTTNDSLIRVPLGLKEGVYISSTDKKDFYDSIQYSGSGKYYIEFDTDLDGYVAVIQNEKTDLAAKKATTPSNDKKNEAKDEKKNEKKPSSDPKQQKDDPIPRQTPKGYLRHTLTLQLCFPIESTGNEEYRLRTTFPPAVHAKVRLVVPIPDVQITTSQGILAMPPITLSESTSEITLNGLNRNGETTELNWRKKDDRSLSNRIVLQVEDAEIQITPSLQDVQFEVTLPIRPDGEAGDTFRIRLPKGARLLRESVVATGLNNNILDIRSILETKQKDDPIVEIRLAHKIQDPLSLRFKAIVQGPQTETKDQKETTAWDLGGFDLLGAQKQYGRIKFRIPKDLNFKIRPQYGVRVHPSEGSDQGKEIEQYSYYAQPFSLNAQMIVQQTRIKVKPEYQILVHKGELRLKARFQYMIYGSKVRELALKIDDWFINEVKSNYLTDLEKIREDHNAKELLLPLATPSEGLIEFELSAVRHLSSESQKLEFTIPIPVADWIEPGAVIIVPDDNVELNPIVDQIRGLRIRTLSSLTTGIEIPSRQQQPLSCIFESRDNRKASPDSLMLPRFVSDIKYHSRKVDVQSQTDIYLAEKESDRIQQTLNYSVKYEPLDSITLSVPNELHDPSAIKITVDGKPVAIQNIISELDDDLAAKTIRKRILLIDSPRIGNCVVSLQYSSRNFDLLPQMTNKIVLDLVQPLDGTLLSNQVNVITPSGINIESGSQEDKSWTFDSARSITKGETLSYRFYSDKIQNQLNLKAIVSARDIFGSTIVERAWIQTWLVNSTRFDRISWKIISDQKSISITLPSRVRRERISLLFNNVLAAIALSSDETADRSKVASFNTKGDLVIPIPDEYRMKPFTLELSWLIDVAPGAEMSEIDFAHFTDPSVWIRRGYWQIILPSNQHLIGNLAGWTPEYIRDIIWSGFHWKRKPSMTQEELAAWVGVDPKEAIPEGINSYLFSSFNPPQRSFLQILDRSILILLGSGFTLILGLSFFYLPILRRRGVLFVLIVLFIALCFYRPAASFLFLQTALLGIVLTLLTFLLSRLFGSTNKNWPGTGIDQSAFSNAMNNTYSGSSMNGHSSLWKDESE